MWHYRIDTFTGKILKSSEHADFDGYNTPQQAYREAEEHQRVFSEMITIITVYTSDTKILCQSSPTSTG